MRGLRKQSPYEGNEETAVADSLQTRRSVLARQALMLPLRPRLSLKAGLRLIELKTRTRASVQLELAEGDPSTDSALIIEDEGIYFAQ